MVIAKFNIQNMALQTFYREIKSRVHVKRYRADDCVINAIQLLGLITPREAHLMRFFLKGGLDGEYIGDLFSVLLPDYNWKFQGYTNPDTFFQRISELEVDQVIFCGYTGHVFLIGRAADGHLYSLDPQVQNKPCLLDDNNLTQCSNSVLNKSWYGILHTIIDDEMDVDE
jgi:hypothetical protein